MIPMNSQVNDVHIMDQLLIDLYVFAQKLAKKQSKIYLY